MNKEVLFLDFDNTLVNSSKRICEMYNEDFKNHPDFKEAKWELEYTWDFTTQCPLAGAKVIERYFTEKRFFNGLEFYDGAKETIKRLSELYTIKIISLGYPDNLKHKREFIKNNLVGISEFIACNLEEMNDKSKFDLSDGILVDDNSKYLFTSNAKIKIAFGRVYDWNRDWDGMRVRDWKALEYCLWRRYYDRV